MRPASPQAKPVTFAQARSTQRPAVGVDAVALGGPTVVRPGLVGSAAMAPEVLGNRYEVGRPIGRGAMTRVLEAWDRPEHRHVALKVPSDRLAGDKAFLERLEREAQTAASLTHPNIAAVHGVGYDTRIGFVVTELVEGPSLRGMLADRGPLPPVGAARVAAGVCAALAAAHRRGVAHGHLTPANVLLAIDGRVKVTDFRLVQAAKPSATASAPTADPARGRPLPGGHADRPGAGGRCADRARPRRARRAGRDRAPGRWRSRRRLPLGRRAPPRPEPVPGQRPQGAPSTAQPDVASGHDRSTVVAVAPSGARTRWTERDSSRSLPLNEQGFYEIRDADAVAPRRVLAVNLDPGESELGVFAPDELVRAVAPPGSANTAVASGTTLSVSERERRQILWWYFLVAALALFAAESLLSNRLSRSARRDVALAEGGIDHA